MAFFMVTSSDMQPRRRMTHGDHATQQGNRNSPYDRSHRRLSVVISGEIKDLPTPARNIGVRTIIKVGRFVKYEKLLQRIFQGSLTTGSPEGFENGIGP